MDKKLSKEEKIALYNKLVATHPDAVLKGATIPYTSLNGHMYSFISREDKYKTKLAENYGIVQKEYVVVPDNFLKKTNELKEYFNISYKYVSSLKPKATVKSKKKNQV